MLRRTLLSRKTPLRAKTPMRRFNPERKRGLAQGLADFLGTSPQHRKREPSVFRSLTHRQNVAALPCVCCGIERHSQAAHLNLLALGKGRGLKLSDALTMPLCMDRIGIQGCHGMLDHSGRMKKSESAAMQIKWLLKTRHRLKRLGLWEPEAELDFRRLVLPYMERTSWKA